MRRLLLLALALLLLPLRAQAAITITESFHEEQTSANGTTWLTCGTGGGCATGSSNADGTFSIGNGNIGYVFVFCTGATVAQPTGLTQTGQTWVWVNGVSYNTIASPATRIDLYRTLGAGAAAAAMQVVYASNKTSVAFRVFEVSGADTTGTNGSGATVQSQVASTDSANSVTPTLDAALQTGSGVIALAGQNVDRNWTCDASWTCGTEYNGSTPVTGSIAQWHDAAIIDVSAAFTWSGTAVAGGGVVVEVKVAGGGGGTPGCKNGLLTMGAGCAP